MPPKPDPSDPNVQKLLSQFASIGFVGQTANNTIRNPKKAEVLSQLIEKNHLGEKNLGSKGGALIVAAASDPPNDLSFENRNYVVERIVDGSLTTTDRVSEACKYMATVQNPAEVNKDSFDAACGVGELSASVLL
jgi:hypothetical protein